MKIKIILLMGATMLSSIVAFAQNKPEVKLYGFVRTFSTIDSRLSKSGTGELYYYVPMDYNYNSKGVDLNALQTAKSASLTSRLGVNSSWTSGNLKVNGKIEADFYSGLSGVTGTAVLRLRQAYFDILTPGFDFKLGQAWHPMAADMPDVFALEVGVPFGPFSRTPQFTMNTEWGKHFVSTISFLTQMQYTSAGPEGSSANYAKYTGFCNPELYVGLTYKGGPFLGRLGYSQMTIRPRYKGMVDGVESFVSDNLSTTSGFVYLQYKRNMFSAKLKSVLAQGGEHLNMLGGYGISHKFTSEGEDGHYEYTPTLTSSSWLSLSYGKKYKVGLFLGYARNFGTTKDLQEIEEGCGWVDSKQNYLAKNTYSNLNSTYRISPSFSWVIGPVTLAFEYSYSAAQYGEYGKFTAQDGTTYTQCVGLRGLAENGLHWVGNHRFQFMSKFSF